MDRLRSTRRTNLFPNQRPEQITCVLNRKGWLFVYTTQEDTLAAPQ
jgi:hypothetical protein